MSSGPNEVQARVHPQITLLRPLRLLLLTHVCLVLVVNEVDNWGPRVTVVDVVAEARRVDHGQLNLELLLLKLSLDYLNLGELVKLLVVAPVVALCGGELGGKERVNECRFA